MKKKYFFIVNPVSGSVDKAPLLEEIKMLMVTSNEVGLYETKKENNEENIKEIIDKHLPERFILVGGDGTIQMVCKLIHEMNVVIDIAILPAGSANGLATCLDLPADLEIGLDYSLHSNKKLAIDFLLVNDKHVCIHLLDIGVNARLVKMYEENNDRGMLGYSKHLIEAITTSEEMLFNIQHHNKEEQQKGHMLTCSNGSKYGTGVTISDGLINDGQFEIRVFPELSWLEAVKSGLTIFDINVDEEMYKDVIQCESASINISPKSPLQIDGEYIGEIDYLKVDVIPSAIKIILPDEA